MERQIPSLIPTRFPTSRLALLIGISWLSQALTVLQPLIRSAARRIVRPPPKGKEAVSSHPLLSCRCLASLGPASKATLACRKLVIPCFPCRRSGTVPFFNSAYNELYRSHQFRTRLPGLPVKATLTRFMFLTMEALGRQGYGGSVPPYLALTPLQPTRADNRTSS